VEGISGTSFLQKDPEKWKRSRDIRIQTTRMEEVHRCVAIKTDGSRCTRNKARDLMRCKMHEKLRTENGPNFTELKEAKYVLDKQRNQIKNQFAQEIDALGRQPWQHPDYRDIIGRRNLALQNHSFDARETLTAIRTRHRNEIVRTGINPDEVPDGIRAAHLRRNQQIRQEAQREAQREARRERVRRIVEGIRNQPQQPFVPLAVFQLGVDFPDQNVRQIDARPLAAFANDAQNIHTTAAVTQTINAVNLIKNIPVPEEYRWNMNKVSKTMSEIISECDLTPASAWQMVAKYCSDERVYEMESGIYGKVLDGVWQHIKNSPDKEDLKKILKSELIDNIGMCAQGNLSRLTNILAGYLDGIAPQQSMSERIGNRLSTLTNIEDVQERLNEAVKIFKEVGLPENEWYHWAEPLLFDQEEDDYREMVIHDGHISFTLLT
jgi:hypothetical protein